MKIKELRTLLLANSNTNLYILMPTGELLPHHFHITEVGRVDKNFIDCGGTVRKKSSCILQAWTANDLEHRLVSNKLLKILELASSLDIDELDVEIEYELESKSQFSLADVQITKDGLWFILDNMKTECLAPDKCGINARNSCCGGNCC